MGRRRGVTKPTGSPHTAARSPRRREAHFPAAAPLAQPRGLNGDPGHRHDAISLLHPRRGFFSSFFNRTMRPSCLSRCMYLTMLNNSCPHLPQLSASCLHSDARTAPSPQTLLSGPGWEEAGDGVFQQGPGSEDQVSVEAAAFREPASHSTG